VSRFAAMIRPTDIHPESRHSMGFPEVDIGADAEIMSWPRVLVIEERKDGVFLDRYTQEGQPAGDTWHASVDEAKDQAQDEYDGMLTDWKEVPPEIGSEELVHFALTQFG